MGAGARRRIMKFSISEPYEDIAARLPTCYEQNKFPLWQLRFSYARIAT